MVNHVRQMLLLILMALVTTHTWADEKGTLDVHVDRKTLHENQTLTLTVKGEMPFSMDLDMLFNIGDLELPSPEEDALKENFEILSKHQKYSLRSVNGDATAIVTWIYELAPKKTGQLEIPSLKFREAHSNPVTITVEPGDAPAPDGTARPAFVEVETDKDSVYVQEQLVLTVRLFYRGNLIRGDLSQPDQGDAIVESMGEQQEYARVRNNVRYRVVERRYAIYPQSAGTLTIDGIKFNGQARDDTGNLTFLRDAADPLDIPVKGIPASFTGDTWLPASSLELSQDWSDPSSTLKAGKSVTRTLTLNALGLLGSALPPLKVEYPDAVRSYPDKPDLKSNVDNRTVTSSRTESTALVAVKPGQITLPEVRVPWWDTVNDKERVAVIPARTVTITDSAGVAATPPAAKNSPSAPDKAEPVVAKTRDTSMAESPQPLHSPLDNTWLWLAVALGTGWALTVLFWWLNRRRATDPSGESGPQGDPAEAALYADLEKAARAGEAQTLSLLPRWARQRFGNQHLRSAGDVVRFSTDETLAEELEKLQERLYGGKASETHWQPEPLLKALQRLRDRPQRQAAPGLAPLYPSSLKAGSANT
ncbi:protein BatD [Marinobacter sp. R17]|uniref:BatD family protein n=1 Tax=Marinobacter sp. R17 TaxID=2484250 RepID=UPI000F4B4FFF|nr:BatD family protein [Marinobacter sp. R17]ROT99238.1 protein BatD [Marinobacter sp. R17]